MKNKCREAFERSKTFKYFFSTLMTFDEELNIYISNNKLRVLDAEKLTAAWWAFEEQYTEINELKATHHGQMIGRDHFLKQLKSKHAAKIDTALNLIKAWEDQSYRDDAEQLISVDLVEALRGES